MAKIERFEEMEAWKCARRITQLIYQISSEGSFAKDFALVNQIRRAAISIMSKYRGRL
jgi:four helix bundle protein